MEFIHVPTLWQDPFESALDELMDFTFPPLRYQPSSRSSPRYFMHGSHYPFRLESRGQVRPTRQSSRRDDEKFSVSLDVRHYTPDEVHLKIEGGSLIVHGRHHREGENGFETSEFKRTYSLPDDVDQSTLTSKINTDGVLQIEAARKKSFDPSTSVGFGALKAEEDSYNIVVPTGDYKPEEITVKVNGRQVTIDGRHEVKEEGEHGEHLHHRQFHRSFVLPTDGDMDAIQSKIQSDGTLKVRVPRNAAALPQERVVPITFEGRDEEDQDGNMEQ